MKHCPFCKIRLIKVDHVEDDGDRGSLESYNECPECDFSPESDEISDCNRCGCPEYDYYLLKGICEVCHSDLTE